MESLCRLCLESTESLTNVLDVKDGRKTSEVIEIICGIKIKIDEHDRFPKQVCDRCLKTVFQAYSLRILCKKNEQYWKRQFASNVLVKDEETIEEYVKCEPSTSPVELNSYEEESVRDYGDDYEIVEVSMQPDFINSEDDENDVFRCDHCSCVKRTKQEIERHLTSEHLTSTTCSTCFKTFISRTILRQHVRKVHPNDDESFPCDQCNLFFRTRRKLDKHQQLHSFFIEEIDDKRMIKTFRCRFCAKTYNMLTDKMQDHMFYHKRSTNSEKRQLFKDDEPLVCPHCGQIYRTKQILQQHIKRHFDTGDKYACPKCPQRFKSWGELYYHNAVHTTDRKFVCEICSKAFKAKRDLRNHRIRHETKDVKKFQCSYCQLMLKSKYTLNRHILIHTGEKKFQCSYCQKAFTQKNELNKHLRVHIGENTYRCEEAGCTQAFRLLAELRLHQQIHYETTSTINVEFEN